MTTRAKLTLDCSDLDNFIGKPMQPARMVEPFANCDIRRWDQAMHYPNRLHYDTMFAMESRFGELIAPQSFPVTMDDGHGSAPSCIGLIPNSQMLFGGDEWWLDDFGDPAMFEGLEVLVNALNTEAALTASGEQRLAASITATLANRLRVEDYLKANPALLDAAVERPTFVFGLPRTGTTLAINLLGADPARRVFMRWEAFATVPPAAKGARRSDPRCREEQARLDMSLKYVPHISAMHHEDADSNCECQFAANPQGKHGQHSYRLEDYGLTRAGVHAHFKDYIERFEIAVRA